MRRGRLSPGVLLAVAITPLGALAGSTGPSTSEPVLSTGPVLDQKLTVVDITISYPTGLESQAKGIATVCQRVIPPRKARLIAAQRAFSDHTAIAKRVADLLGSPEHADLAYQVLSAPGPAIDRFLLPMFSEVRIYKESDLKTSGGVHAGPISLVYDPKIDKVTFQFGMSRSSESVAPSVEGGFLPVVVRDDGTFRAQGGIAEHVSGMLDELVIPLAVGLHASMIHEAAESILVVKRGFDHPFTRWFNEGAANWIALQVVDQLAPESSSSCRARLLPDPQDSRLREKINLLAWPQLDYEKQWALAEEIEISRASYRYATELIARVLRDQPAGTLAKVVRKLKGSCSPDTDAVCQVLRDVTGKNAKSLLLEYVPASVREGLKQYLPSKKLEKGYEALAAGDVWQAYRLLQEALDMAPSDADAHLNLAIAFRREPGWGQPPRPRSEYGQWQESERHIAIAAALSKCDMSRQFTVHAPVDDDARYVLGRAEQIRGRTKEAREILSKLPKTHEDAQSALKEMED